MILNPSCSEVVFRLDCKDLKEAKKLLKEIGIIEFEVDNYWDWEPKTKVKMLLDLDNPNLPDFDNHARLELNDKDNGYGVEGVYLEGDQHGQHQLFKTMKKVEDNFSGEWQGQDGGSMNDYEEWKEKGCKKVPDYNKKYKKRRNKLLGMKDL